MARYEFVTFWRVDAPIEGVYDAIADSLTWPTWWSNVLGVEPVSPGDPTTGIGDVRHYVFRGSLPYTLGFDLRVTEIVRPTRLAGEASGELEGRGVWTLTAAGPLTTLVRYDWQIRTTRWWMNLLAPIAGGIFRSNHDVVMRGGASGIGKLLGVEAADETEARLARETAGGV